MPRVAVVLPVSASADVLEKVREDYRPEALGAETTFSFVDGAPATIESPEHVAAAERGVVEAAVRLADEGADAIVVACFSNAGVAAAAEAVSIPVVGEGLATLATTGAVYTSFSLLSASSATVPAKARLVASLGLESRLRRIVPLDIPMLEFTTERVPEVAAAIADEARAGVRAVVVTSSGLRPGFMDALRVALPEDVAGRVAVIDPADVAGRVAVMLASSARSVA